MTTEGAWSQWPAPEVTEARRLIAEFYEQPGCGAGGPLHIVTDDDNVEDDHLQFCRQAVADVRAGTTQWHENVPPAALDLADKILDLLWPMSEAQRQQAVAA